MAPPGDSSLTRGKKRARPRDITTVASSMPRTDEDAHDFIDSSSKASPSFPASAAATPGPQKQANDTTSHDLLQRILASTSNQQVSTSRMATGTSSSLIDHLRSRPHHSSTPGHQFAPGSRTPPASSLGLSQEQFLALILQDQQNEIPASNATIDDGRSLLATQNTVFGRTSQGQSNQRQTLSDESILATRLAGVQQYHGLQQLLNAGNARAAMMNSLSTTGAPNQQNSVARQQQALLDSLFLSNVSSKIGAPSVCFLQLIGFCHGLLTAFAEDLPRNASTNFKFARYNALAA